MGRQRLRALGGFGAFGLFWGAWGASLPAVQAHAGVDDGALGVALLMIGLGALLTMRVTGGLLDRLGRHVVVVATIAFGAAGFVPTIVHGVVGLSLAALFLGMTSGAMDVGVNAVAVDFEAGPGGRILNTCHALFSICVVLSSLGVAGLRSLDVPVWALLLCTQAVIVAFALTVMPSREPWLNRHHDESTAQDAAKPARRGRVPTVLVVLGALGAAAFLLENAWQTWSAILLQQDKGAGAATSALGPAVFAAMAASGRLLGDPLARRLSPGLLLSAGASIAAVGSLLAARASDAALSILGIAIAGFGTSVCAPTVIGLAGRAVTRLGRATAVSTVTTISYLGFLVGPPLVGLIAGRTSLPTALTLVALEAAVLALAAGTIRGINTNRPAPTTANPQAQAVDSTQRG